MGSILSSRLWEGALRDDAKNGCEADSKEAGPAMLNKHILVNLKGKKYY